MIDSLLSYHIMEKFSVEISSSRMISKANISISKSFFSKGRPWGLNIIMEMDLEKLYWLDSRGFTNLYCNWYVSYRFAQCDVRSPCTRRYLGRTYQCAVVVLVMWQNWVIDIISTLAKTGWPENIDTKSIWGNKSNYRLYIVCWKYNCHNGDQTHYEDAFSFLLLQ